MRRSRALSVAAIGVATALVATACSGSGGSSNKTSGTKGSPNGGKTSASSSGAGGLPLNTNAGSGSPVKGGTLHMLGVGDVDYMDPNISYYSVGYLTLRLWSRQLVTYPAIPGKTTQAAPDLATELPTQANGGISADGKTYKFTIRKGAMWDTTPARQVTAADLVRGLKRTCNPKQPFGGMPDFQDLIVGLANYCAGFSKVNPNSATAIANYQNTHDIAGVSVDPSNPLTVVYKLTHPASYFLQMMTLPAFSPSPVEYDKYIPASAELAQHTISDGPYKITSYNATKSIEFARNPAWKASTDPIRKAYVNAIDINETGNQDAIQQQMKAEANGSAMDYDTSPPNTALPQLIATKDPNFNLQPTFSSNPYVVFNLASPNNGGAMKKPAVRRAISEALNRDNLIQDNAGPQVAPPLTHVLPAGTSGIKSNTSPSYYPYNVKKAKKDLAAAGASHLTLKFLYRPATSTSKAMFLTIQQDLSKVGIKVVGVGVPNADFYTKYLQVPSVAKRGVWDLSLAGWGPDWYGDSALSFFAPLFYGNGGKAGSAFPPNGSDFGLYDNPALDRLIVQAQQQADPAKATQLWSQADALVMKDAAFFPITAPNWPTYHTSNVHNTIQIPAFQGLDAANVWLSNS